MLLHTQLKTHGELIQMSCCKGHKRKLLILVNMLYRVAYCPKCKKLQHFNRPNTQLKGDLG